MNSTSEEKKLLIESMKKLVTHVSNNPQRQKEIFDALSLQDLNKIILNLRDDNQYLRRISALLLCELFYQNSDTKMAAVKLLGIQPHFGRICLSGIPESIHKYPSTLKKCIELMQTPVLAEEEDERICWIINLERKSLKLEILEYKKYSSFTFIDPLKNIFGFASFPAHKETPKEGKEIQVSIERARDVEGRAVTSPLTQSTQLNSQFYKNYIQSRNKSKESKESKRASFSSNYNNLSVDLGEATRPGFTRPITSRQNNYTSRQEPNNSFEVRPTTIPNISQYTRNGYINNSKMNKSTYDPPSSHSQKVQHQQVLTDREVRERRSSGNTSPVVSNHQKFYKRVKDILRK